MCVFSSDEFIWDHADIMISNREEGRGGGLSKYHNLPASGVSLPILTTSRGGPKKKGNFMVAKYLQFASLRCFSPNFLQH